MTRPLEGMRVLDLTQLLSGPYCTMMLADMGADVLKVEPPGGEMQRQAMRVDQTDESPPFMAINRNKRGLVVDLRHPQGRSLLLDLAATCDVMVENYRPGTTAKLGIDYESVRAVRPQIIYASITGFGQAGPYANRPGLDLVTQGMSGLMSITGHPGGEPAKIGVPITDIAAGMYCAIGILGAYIGLRQSGEGERVTTSLFAAGVSLGLWEAMEYWNTGRIPAPLGSAHRLAAPYQALRTEDGYLTVGAGTDKLWVRMCTAIGRDDLVTDGRFETNAKRVANRLLLQSELEVTLKTGSTHDWVAILTEAGVPAGPILDYGQVLDDAHTAASGMILEYEHPTAGRVRTLGAPYRLAGNDTETRAAPLIGQHTDEVLGQLGFDPDRIAELHKMGVV
jgi:crotonobetainyl-CoA:carnitine CoA-transferase CaiB-like acyl-CoA transferase